MLPEHLTAPLDPLSVSPEPNSLFGAPAFASSLDHDRTSSLDCSTQSTSTMLNEALQHPCFGHHAYRELEARLHEAPDQPLKVLLPTCPAGRPRWPGQGTGRLRDDPCGRNFCPRCVSRVANETAWALDLATPDLFVTVTRLPADWQQIRRLMNALANQVRRRGCDWLWAYHVEGNPASDGAHAHAWVRGDLPEGDALAVACAQAGVGRPHIEPVWSVGRALPYGMKNVLRSFDLPAALALANQATFLRLNGGRLVHHSRGFFLDRDGAPAGLRSAKRAVTRPFGQGQA